ncbi:MAG: HlyC/CorC family transporter [Deltaproteobacteria bacterium]|nr:HlyC/CorC family transporter [Deltaproteobacteria bacterium]
MDDSIEGLGSEFLGILACITLGTMFSAVDEAMVALGEFRVRTASEANDKSARAAARFLEMAPVIQARLFMGRVLCVTGAAILASDLGYKIAGLHGEIIAFLAAVLAYTVIVGTATALVVRRASRLALPLLRFFRPLELFMAPFAVPLILVSSLIKRLYPARPEDAPERVTEVDVEQLIDQGEEHGSITEEHADLLRSVLEFADTVVREVMVPRTSMVAIDINTPLREVSRLVVEKGHSRYPVYRGTIDQIEGILYAKDLFRFIDEKNGMSGKLEDLIRDRVFFVAESQKISGVLRDMQARRVHLSVAIDEFGGTSGMVTLEDIIEEIVGEIQDEHDSEDLSARKIAQGHYLANAKVSIYDLAELTGMQLPEEARSYESLGGMIVDLMGRVPSKGDSVQFGSYDFIIRGADERHVTRVEIVQRREPMLVRK